MGMLLLKSMIIVLSLVVFPALLGELITYKDTSDIVKPFQVRYIMGLFLELSLFWVLCVPMTFLKVPFTVLTIIYSCVVLVLGSVAIWVCYRKKQFGKNLKHCKDILSGGWTLVYFVMFIALLGIQLYYTALYEGTVWTADDADYIVHSMNTISSDHMYLNSTVTGFETVFIFKRILNSWSIYIAYLSRISGFHVTTIAHTIIPVVFLLVAYVVYSYIAVCWLDKREDRFIFLILVSVVFMFGHYSQYSLTFRLLVTLWQGKAVLSAIVIPFLIAFLPKVYEQKLNMRALFYVILISMTSCSFTMMGSGMTIIIYIIMWLVTAVSKRRFTGVWYCLGGCVIPVIQMMLYLTLR